MSSQLLQQVKNCCHCQAFLPLPAKPILQFNPEAKILIAGHAPGRKTHEQGMPFMDASGKRLRQWLGVSEQEFYNEQLFAILPMGFCYPGTGNSGDLPPRPECAPLWREHLLNELRELQLTLILGEHAMAYHWHTPKQTVTQAAKGWQQALPNAMVLPHPSPRNNRWLKSNPWFEKQAVLALQQRIKQIIQPTKEYP